MKYLVLVFGVVLSGFANAQEIFGDGKVTYALAPAEVISSGVVNSVQISTSSRFVVYRKAPIAALEDVIAGKVNSSGQWYFYDRVSKQNARLALPEDVREVSILGDSQNAFFCGFGDNASQGFVNLKTGAVSNSKIDLNHMVYAGDQAAYPFVMTQDDNQSVRITPVTGQAFTFTAPPKVRVFSPSGSDAQNLYFRGIRRATPLQYCEITVQLSDGVASVKQMTREQWLKDAPWNQHKNMFYAWPVGDVTVVKMTDLPKDVKSDLPTQAKLGMANCQAEFSPDNSFVVYKDAGALLVRDIKPIDAALAKKLFNDELKAKALSNAKQAALAFIMYASDMDDILPGAEGWENKVDPYIKDMDLLRNFNYTFRGGNLNDIESPAETELGFVVGPGGRAVAYTDGHVRWIPNP